jgi:hypothetical protein
VRSNPARVCGLKLLLRVFIYIHRWTIFDKCFKRKCFYQFLFISCKFREIGPRSKRVNFDLVIEKKDFLCSKSSNARSSNKEDCIFKLGSGDGYIYLHVQLIELSIIFDCTVNIEDCF